MGEGLLIQHNLIPAAAACGPSHKYSCTGVYLPDFRDVLLDLCVCSAGGYLPIDKSEGPQAQYSYYQQTYQQAQQSLDSNTGLKGIMFWRWAGVDPTAQLASTDFNEAATIGESLPLYLVNRDTTLQYLLSCCRRAPHHH